MPHHTARNDDAPKTLVATSKNATVITVETSAANKPKAWFDFLTQRLHVLHLDYKTIGDKRIVVRSAPSTGGSVLRLVRCAIDLADQYVQPLLDVAASQGSARARVAGEDFSEPQTFVFAR